MIDRDKLLIYLNAHWLDEVPVEKLADDILALEKKPDYEEITTEIKWNQNVIGAEMVIGIMMRPKWNKENDILFKKLEDKKIKIQIWKVKE